MTRAPNRRRFLRTVAAGAAAGLAGCSRSTDPQGAGDAPDTTPRDGPGGLPDSVGLETLASGFQAPVAVAFPPADRRYIADQAGVIRVHESGNVRDEPLLDLGDAVEFGGEKGLLGLALHPDFATNRRLFVRYSAPAREGTPSNYSHTFVLAEFIVRDGARAERDSERTILEIPEPQGNHNAGDIAFGPDGHLYVPVGDGGAGGDRGTGHVDDWYDAVAGGNGQDVAENLLGSILRIDVTERGMSSPYTVPEDNPLVGREGFDEHYAWGLRNPWRIAFDDGRLFVGDVGQNEFEEISLVENGGNYGWNVKEGTHCYAAQDCPDRAPEDVRGGEPLVDPIVEYPHGGRAVSGRSVIGGHVYRGSAITDLEGTYVFGDLAADGELFVATEPDDGGRWPTGVVSVRGTDAGKLDRIVAFGRDRDGEVYVLGTGDDGGAVHRIVPGE